MTSWTHAIQDATDRKALAALVNDYLAMWSPREMASVPAECRPERIRGVEDIEYWRERLSDAYCSGAVHDEANGAISRLIAFFSAACERLSSLQATSPRDVGDSHGPGRANGPSSQPQGD